MPAAIAFIREHRAPHARPAPTARHRHERRRGSTSGDAVVRLGRPARTRQGGRAQLRRDRRRIKALGVEQCGVRFRSRTCDELLDQIDAFGRDVAPLLNA